MAQDERLALSRELVALLEAGKEQEADQVFNNLIDYQESSLFQEVGRLTRDLHEAIKDYRDKHP